MLRFLRSGAVLIIACTLMLCACAPDSDLAVMAPLELPSQPSPTPTPIAQNPVKVMLAEYQAAFTPYRDVDVNASANDFFLSLESQHLGIESALFSLSRLPYVSEGVYEGTVFGARPGSGYIKDDEGTVTFSLSLQQGGYVSGTIENDVLLYTWYDEEQNVVNLGELNASEDVFFASLTSQGETSMLYIDETSLSYAPTIAIAPEEVIPDDEEAEDEELATPIETPSPTPQPQKSDPASWVVPYLYIEGSAVYMR